MTQTPPRLARRVAIEATTIVASILIAFAIDAWWAERNERIEEREAIEGLLTDFRETQRRTSELRAQLQESVDAAGTLLAMADGGPGTSTAQTDSLIFLLVQRHALSTTEANLTALLESGRLRLIRNDSLRVALAGWGQVKARPATALDQDDRTVGDHLLPYLWDTVSMRAVDSAGGLQAFGAGSKPHDASRLLRDRKFENLVNERIALLTVALRGLASVDNHVETTLRLLEEER
ncbi:MAG: hypothetical protein ACF8NJ_07770 [Phycisphaerales bacterium JB038]